METPRRVCTNILPMGIKVKRLSRYCNTTGPLISSGRPLHKVAGSTCLSGVSALCLTDGQFTTSMK